MSTWYFEKEGTQQGPVTEIEIRDLLASGELTPQALVWREGMDGWTPAAEVETFAPAPPAPAAAGELSPYAPPAAEPAVIEMPIPTSGSQVRPWIRYWARSFDTLVFALLFGALLGLVFPAALEINDLVFNMLALAAMAFFEAACLATFSTTPGKALFRIRVCNPDGSRPGYGHALARSLKVFMKGVGLGIPLVALITQIVGYQTLNRDGITSWDREGGHVVAHQEIPPWRALVIVLVLVGTVAGFSYLAYLGMSETEL